MQRNPGAVLSDVRRSAAFRPRAGIRPVGLWLIVSMLLAAAPGKAAAQDSILEMFHKSWTARDGAPSNIESIAATADGLLWLATDSGLYFFDCVSLRALHAAERFRSALGFTLRTVCNARWQPLGSRRRHPEQSADWALLTSEVKSVSTSALPGVCLRHQVERVRQLKYPHRATTRQIARLITNIQNNSVTFTLDVVTVFRFKDPRRWFGLTLRNVRLHDEIHPPGITGFAQVRHRYVTLRFRSSGHEKHSKSFFPGEVEELKHRRDNRIMRIRKELVLIKLRLCRESAEAAGSHDIRVSGTGQAKPNHCLIGDQMMALSSYIQTEAALS